MMLAGWTTRTISPVYEKKSAYNSTPIYQDCMRFFFHHLLRTAAPRYERTCLCCSSNCRCWAPVTQDNTCKPGETDEQCRHMKDYLGYIFQSSIHCCNKLQDMLREGAQNTSAPPKAPGGICFLWDPLIRNYSSTCHVVKGKPVSSRTVISCQVGLVESYSGVGGVWV